MSPRATLSFSCLSFQCFMSLPHTRTHTHACTNPFFSVMKGIPDNISFCPLILQLASLANKVFKKFNHHLITPNSKFFNII